MPSGRVRLEARMQLGRESGQIPKCDRLADLPHDVKVKVDVVEGTEDGREKFPGEKQVAQVGARIPAASGAMALIVQWPWVSGIARIPDEHAAVTCVQARAARVGSTQSIMSMPSAT